MCSFCNRIQSRAPCHTFSCHVFLDPSGLFLFFFMFHVLIDMSTDKETCRKISSPSLSDVFLMMRLELWVSWKHIIEMKCPFYLITWEGTQYPHATVFSSMGLRNEPYIHLPSHTIQNNSFTLKVLLYFNTPISDNTWQPIMFFASIVLPFLEGHMNGIVPFGSGFLVKCSKVSSMLCESKVVSFSH